MPRRLPVRPAKVFGNFFVLIVLCLMSLIYYTNVFIVWAPRAYCKYIFFYPKFIRYKCFIADNRVIALLIVYNILFVMLVWSFF